jgi:quercetin dioxygenase-like cupin family protein
MNLTVASLLIACVPLTSAMAQKHKAPAKAPSEVEITSEPNHHLVLQNSYVRVFQVEAAPHASTLMHRHRHDYIFVTLGTTEISNEVRGKAPATMKLQDGETRFVPGNFAHVVRNLSDTPFRNVTIELLRAPKTDAAPQDDDRSLHVLHGGTQEVVFVKDGVRASEVELQTAGVAPKHHHAAPRLIVAVSDLVLRNDQVGKSASNIEMKAGDVKWLEGGITDTLTNVGPKEAKFVMLEF